VWFHNQAQQQWLHVPALRSRRTGWVDLLKDRNFSVVLDYVAGSTLSRSSPLSAIESLGQTLGRLHSITSKQHGPLMTYLPSRGNYLQAQQAYWQKTAQLLERQAAFAESQNIQQVLGWLNEHSRFLDDIKQFNLIHGDPSGGNFLLTEPDKLWLIDCDRIGFEPGARELASALLEGYCAADMQRCQHLVDAYLQHCPDEARRLWLAHAQFFIATALLWRTQRKLQWSLKRPDKKNAPLRAIRAWQQLLAITGAKDGDWQTLLALLTDK
ncbi:MAG: aminoglycoside phosphotransferase family protein, partial [Salinisphaeraceae bacterium]|nr:aminoglycoside phosphotransferase family protein [Salinisphaeraceae bacterium]